MQGHPMSPSASNYRITYYLLDRTCHYPSTKFYSSAKLTARPSRGLSARGLNGPFDNEKDETHSDTQCVRLVVLH